MRKICIMSNAPIKDYYEKGEIKERYFNPCDFFDEVHIISPCNKDIDKEKVQKIAGKAKLKIWPMGWFRFRRVWQFFSIRNKILTLIKNIKPDVIRAYDPYIQGYFAVYCGKKLEIPTVISIHNEPNKVRELERDPILFFLRFVEKKVISNVDKVICVTNNLKTYAKKNGAKNIDVIYNRVDTRRFINLKLNKDFKKKKILTIISVGRLTKDRYLECLIESIKGLNVKLMLVGNGNLIYNLKKFSKKMGVKNQIIFVGPIHHSKIHKYYFKADIFAAVRYHEGFGIPFIEAMSSSLPIISSDIPTIKEIVGDAGILVNNNPNDFREAFKKIISDVKLRKILGERGRKRALNFENSIIETKEMNFYKKLIKGERNGNNYIKKKWKKKME